MRICLSFHCLFCKKTTTWYIVEYKDAIRGRFGFLWHFILFFCDSSFDEVTRKYHRMSNRYNQFISMQRNLMDN